MTDKPKRPRGRPRKVKITSSFPDALSKSDAPQSPVQAMTQGFTDLIAPASALQKSVRPVTIREDYSEKFSKSKIVFSKQDNLLQNSVQKGWDRISDDDLRTISQMDPYISAIISTRVSQAVTVGRPSNSKFDKGTRVLELKPLKMADFNNDKVAYRNAQRERANKMEAILDWFRNCGTSNIDVLNAIYESNPDPTFKRCSLSDYIGAQARNLLTFGRAGRLNTRDDNDTVVAFRPVPIETIIPWQSQERVTVGSRGYETQPQSITDSIEYNNIPKGQRPPAFVQRVSGADVNFFTDADLTITYFQKQALFDLHGYPWSPIEMALYMVFVHHETLNYLRNQFVKGIGSKGMLVVKSDDPSAQLGPEDLDELRQQFHNYISRNDNSASTPVISGPIDVQYVSLSATPRDMEFLQLEEHIVRALCSAMQISPQEMGYGNLSQGQGGLTQANKQQEMTQGEERGLRMLLDIIYDDLNEILIEHFPEARDNFRLAYTGVGEDTRDAVAQRSNAELATTATLASLFADSEKTTTVPYGGDVPLSPLWHANVVKYMKMGRFLEEFFGEVGAAEDPALDFYIDPIINQSYLMLKTGQTQAQAEQAQLQTQSLDIQNQMGQIQLGAGEQQQGEEEQSQDESQPDPETEQKLAESQDKLAMLRELHEQKMRHKDAEHALKLESSRQPPEPEAEMDKSEDGPASLADALTEKDKSKGPMSLAEAFEEKSKLKKSVQSYFQSWLGAHLDK